MFSRDEAPVPLLDHGLQGRGLAINGLSTGEAKTAVRAAEARLIGALAQSGYTLRDNIEVPVAID